MANAISALASSALLLPLPRINTDVAAPTVPAAPTVTPRALTLPPFPTPLAQAILQLLPAMTSISPRAEAAPTNVNAVQTPIAVMTIPIEARFPVTEAAPERSLAQIFQLQTPTPAAGNDDAQRAWAALSSGLLTPTLLRQAYGPDDDASASADPDAALIRAAQEAAAFIGNRLKVSVEFEQISLPDLFSIKESADSPLAALVERFMPAILGDLLLRDERIMLAMATTRTSFVPTSRIALRLPYVSGSAQTDAASRGHRRLYDASARERTPFTQRACSIRLAEGVVISGIQIATPILVDGRHWGCLRLAYRRN